jgi:hypothetical protein
VGRGLLLLALLYGCGDARFDGYRPHLLDRPLREFHRTAERAASDVRRVLVLLDDARSMRYLATALRRLDRQF